MKLEAEGWKTLSRKSGEGIFMGLESLGKLLLMVGGMLLGIGLLFLLLGRLGLGKLPGDIVIQGERYMIYFPLVTMIIISVVLTLILNLLRRL